MVQRDVLGIMDYVLCSAQPQNRKTVKQLFRIKPIV